MKSFFLYFVYTLPFAVYSASATCTEENSYRFQSIDRNYPFDRSPLYRRLNLGFQPRICTAFTPRRYRQLLDSITVTCSNVSSDLFLNYRQHNTYVPHSLLIQNSVIPNLPSNSSLSGIEKLRNLVLKNLSIEDLSTGAFDGLNGLQTLNLAFNKLKEIPFGIFDKLSSLINLDLKNNLINKLERKSFSGLVALKELGLNGNNLNVLSDDVFDYLKALELLDVSDNPLEQFPNASFSHLNKLILKNTRLKKLDVNLTQSPLAEIDLSRTLLETINFDNLPSLKVLILSRNRIKVIQNWNKLHAVEAFLDHNNITEVKFLCNVKILDVSHNHIRSLKKEYIHSNNPLIILNLAFNEISVIEEGVFKDFVHLEMLRLEHNNIMVINQNTFVNCSSLNIVDLSYNNIQSISPLAFIQNDRLILINFSHNHLTTVSSTMLSNVQQLRNLYIDNNNVGWFDVRKFDHLETLSMNNNSWSCEDLSDILHNLRIENVNVIDATSLNGDTDNVDGIACVFNKKS